MFLAAQRRSTPRWGLRSGARAGVVTVLLVLASCVAASSALATSFQRGDVLTSVGGAINQYAPNGTLRQTFATGSGAANLCFDPNAQDLIAPGVGLFGRSGNMLASNWASYAPVGGNTECAVDGLGHVYAPEGPTGINGSGQPFATIGQYSLTGTLLTSFTVDATDTSAGPGVYGLDVAPDECTLYYNASGGSVLHRFNVCTNTQESALGGPIGGRNQLRILPNGEVGQVFDGAVQLFDPTGVQTLQDWGVQDFGPIAASNMRFISLDPDGTSMWVGSLAPTAVWRLDTTNGSVLTSFGVTGCGSPAGCGVHGLAAFAPPLLGNADVSPWADANAAGRAEAFPVTAGYSGQMTTLHVYLDSSSAAGRVVVGVYTDRLARPGTLLTQATVTGATAGSWNEVSLPSGVAVTAGQRYWIAVLSPNGGGTVRLRGVRLGGAAQISLQHTLTALPTRWQAGGQKSVGSVSAFGS